MAFASDSQNRFSQLLGCSVGLAGILLAGIGFLTWINRPPSAANKPIATVPDKIVSRPKGSIESDLDAAKVELRIELVAPSTTWKGMEEVQRRLEAVLSLCKELARHEAADIKGNETHVLELRLMRKHLVDLLPQLDSYLLAVRQANPQWNQSSFQPTIPAFKILWTVSDLRNESIRAGMERFGIQVK
jgi:hypothetical protein